jgi:ribonuclease HI
VPRERYYVVWRGRKRGIFNTWAECEQQVKGFVNAEYKGFGSLDEARAALKGSYEEFRGRPSSLGRWTIAAVKPKLPSICVDAACSGSPGKLEYRGVDTATRKVLFRAGPFADGTNNVGEFLAIIEALRWLRNHEAARPVYSDSENAIAWVRAKKCKTKLARTAQNRRLFEMISRAEDELRRGEFQSVRDGVRQEWQVLKWDTASWGEIPADFGRK